MATFEHIHRFRDDRLKNYLEKPRRGYQPLHLHIEEDLLTANRDVLYACNAEARINFAHIAYRTVDESAFVDMGPCYFVTYAPADCVFPIAQAGDFDTAKLEGRLRQAMPGIPFIGMIEAALYKEWGRYGPTPRHDSVSWHVHLITWLTERSVLEAATTPLIDRVQNMHGRSPIHIREIRGPQVELMLLYMLKGQIKEYRVRRTPGIQTDPTTGEIRHKTLQQKRWMRTGDHVRMCAVFQDRWLPDFLFGNAAGSWLSRIIRYRAMRNFCDRAQPENDRAKSQERELPYPQVEMNRKLGQQIARASDEIQTLFPKNRFEDAAVRSRV